MIEFDKIDRSVPILESKGLCKYFGGLKAVENVDMKVMAGDIFGIIGWRRGIGWNGGAG